ncbi:hypothetical protein PSQ39_21245 [Curvibacter sp. HBC28]|uniref:Uncharacterized protein n=1 Tax=Curvibacter microcysteis TaxID=3026419 RepID=A0ABT5MMI6_9BURK|nr:hypothetical protein [Curvibacter sp. HBC28]MDD0817174.1 hypothetical protein [Curvibacter sp. HBC28]
MADLTTWARPNLEKLATDLLAKNKELRAERDTALAAWRAEVCRAAGAAATTEQHQENGEDHGKRISVIG